MHEALEFRNHFNVTWPIVVDSPEEGDPFMNMFGAWPTRFFLVRGRMLSFIAAPREDHEIHIEDIEFALEKALSS